MGVADIDRYRQRLLDLMDQRRVELGRTWDEVNENGGPTYQTIRNIRGEQATIRPLTKRGIEIGLAWERGSVDKILAGGDPSPLVEQPEQRPETIDELVEQIDAMEEIPEARRQQIINEIRKAEAELDYRRKLAHDEIRRYRSRTA